MSSVDTQEIANFSKDSDHWWDENGPFNPLHQLNPTRMSYIKSQICSHFGRDAESLKPFEDLSILDVGCGGGLVCEPLTRLGAKVTGVDADENAIAVAKQHAKNSGLYIDYQNTVAEHIEQQFDIVLALEIIEHVSNPEIFVKRIAKLTKPGGLAIFSTLNRNAKSFLMGIVAAEYLLRWVPRGTHRWNRFIRPSELAKMARLANLNPYDLTGQIFTPVENQFMLSERDTDVNYLLSCKND